MSIIADYIDPTPLAHANRHITAFRIVDSVDYDPVAHDDRDSNHQWIPGDYHMRSGGLGHTFMYHGTSWCRLPAILSHGRLTRGSNARSRKSGSGERVYGIYCSADVTQSMGYSPYDKESHACMLLIQLNHSISLREKANSTAGMQRVTLEGCHKLSYLLLIPCLLYTSPSPRDS